jgi:hypothetical protein
LVALNSTFPATDTNWSKIISAIQYQTQDTYDSGDDVRTTQLVWLDGTPSPTTRLLRDGGLLTPTIPGVTPIYVTPNVQAITSAAVVTPVFGQDVIKVTAQAAAINFANPTGTAIDGWKMSVRVKDNGTGRAITYGSQYRAIGVTLPTTTVATKQHYFTMVYNSDDTKWDVITVGQQA